MRSRGPIVVMVFKSQPTYSLYRRISYFCKPIKVELCCQTYIEVVITAVIPDFRRKRRKLNSLYGAVYYNMCILDISKRLKINCFVFPFPGLEIKPYIFDTSVHGKRVTHGDNET